MERPELTLPTEVEPRSNRQLVICSSGRGGLFADRINSLVPGRYSETVLLNPQQQITAKELRPLFQEVQADRLLKRQIANWLLKTTEGRPVQAGADYLYGSAGIWQLRRDLMRISALKTRCLFHLFHQAFQDGKPYVECDIVTRDTGQLYKVGNFDLFVYQSHPGTDEGLQLSQFKDLFDAEYAILGTAAVIVKGRFPTATYDDLFRTLSVLYGFAHNLQIPEAFIPSDMDIKIYNPFFLSAFRITFEAESFDEVLPYLRVDDVPGGVEWDHHRMEELIELFIFPTGQAYLEVPSPYFGEHGLSQINKLGFEKWKRLLGDGKVLSDSYYADFTHIRQGMPPRASLQRIFAENEPVPVVA